MAPSAVASGEPRCVDDLLGDLIEGQGERRALAVVALFSVAHCSQVREAFLSRDNALRALADAVGDISKSAYVVRWETLALMGELCRRERQTSKDPTDPISKQNATAEEIAQRLAEYPSLQKSLEDNMNEKSSTHETSAEIASDLLSALPFANITGWKTKAKDLLYLDPRLTKPWPRVTRASRQRCTQCGDPVNEPMRCSQCKSVFYCGAACQKKHWKTGHKARCSTFVKQDSTNSVTNESKLFLPTRAQLYNARNKMLAGVSFDSYFFEYVVPEEDVPADLDPVRAAAAAAAAPATASASASASDAAAPAQ